MSFTPLSGQPEQSGQTFPAPLRLDMAPLPRPLSSLVNRQHELAVIARLLRRSDVRLLTLTGVGGVGKSRLAIAAATQAAPEFPDGAVFVGLGAIVDPGLVADTIARALGLRDMGSEPVSGRLLRALAQARLLLVLDNFEQVVEAAPLVSALLGHAPELKILATSRVRLRLSGEREVPIFPLALPEVAPPRGGELDLQADAVRLFIERAQAVQPNFPQDEEDLSAIAEIVRRLDGLPLAIELAASRVKSLPPPRLLDRLESRLPLLTGGGRDLPARQQTMRDAIAWSYDLLSEAEQGLFRALGVFVGGFTLQAAETICPEQDGAIDVVDGITMLVEQSLLGLDPAARYLMLETVREFAVERLKISGEADDVRRRHASFFLALAEEAESHLGGAAQAEWLDRLEADHANLRAALAWATAHDIELALRLGAAMRALWRIRGHLSEGSEALARVLTPGEGTPAARAKALVALASIRNHQADYAAAAMLAEEARVLAEGLGDRHGIAEALRRMAPQYVVLAMMETPTNQELIARGQALWEEELAIRQEFDDRDGIAWALHNLGFPALAAGDLERAATRFAEAVSAFSALGDQYGMAFALTSLGLVTALQGNDADAATLLTRALSIFRDLRDRWGMTHTLEYVSWHALRAGRADVAARLLAAAAALREAEGVTFLLVNYPDHDRAIDAARKALGETAFAAAMAEGRKLSVEAAVAEAFEALTVLAHGSGDLPDDGSRLTRREREVLALVAEGRTNKQIAEALYISPSTVKYHVASLLHKLDADTRAQLVALAAERGLLSR